MAEISDLGVKIKIDKSGFQDLARESKKVGDQIDKTGRQSVSTFSKMDQSLRANVKSMIAYAAAAAGAVIAIRAISTAISRSVTESAQQQLIFANLQSTLKNVGIAYADVEGEISSTFEAIQKTTQFGDTEQAETLQRLIAFTGDYELGLKSLKSTIDFAAGAQLDLNTASRLIGQAIDGNVSILGRYERSLVNIDAETVKSMTRTQRLELVLGALDKRYKGIAETAGNTYLGALSQLRNAQGDLREAIGDFITQSPQFIALIKEIGDSYINAAKRVDEYRKNQETANEISDQVINKLEGIATGITIISNVVKTFGNVVSIVFSAAETIVSQVAGTIANAGAGLLRTELALLELSRNIPDLPILNNLRVSDETLNKIKTDIANLEQFTVQSAQGIESSFANVKSEFIELLDNLGSIGDTSQIQAFFDRVRERAAALRDQLELNRNTTNKLAGDTDELSDKTEKAGKALEGMERQQVSFTQSLLDQATELQKSIALFGATNTEIIKYEANELRAQAAALGLTNQVSGFIDVIELLRLKLNELELEEKLIEQVEGLSDAFLGSLTDSADNIKDTLNATQIFASSVASNINTAFANTLEELIFDFNNFGDSVKNVLRSIANSFFQLVATFATNPLRISLEQSLGGAGGPIAAGAGGIGSIFGGIGSSFGALGSLFGIGSGGAAATGIPGIATLTGVNATAGFGSTLLAAIPAIGAILAAAAIAIPIIADLLKKTPRFAFKFEDVETAVGERAALVSEFLDTDFFKNEIFQRIVGRGGKGAFTGKNLDKIIDAVQEAIGATIGSIRDILFQLPTDMANFLNDALLNTAVDIETKIGRSNLLGFDSKGAKKIKERLEQFFQGDLQARFLFAIRDFFEFSFEQLGLLPEAASSFIDEQFEAFKNAGSQEARAAIGQGLLENFQTFVDAFNIIEGNANDALSLAINSVESLSRSLGFEAVPSIDELTDKLRELVESAEVDPSVIQSFIDLRAALVGLRLEIVSSIGSIISTIQSLNATIVSFGGSAIGLTGFIEDGIQSIENLLSQPGLSLSEQEALLGELSGFANSLLAEEQAAFQQAQQAQQRAIEAQRAGIQSRIDGYSARGIRSKRHSD